MITDEKILQVSDEYIRLRVPDLSDAFFFDIETTGFKASRSHLYMIGCAYMDKNLTWKVRQYMSVRPQEEASLVRSFSDFASSFHTVIHFNGDRFDIPYMNEKYAQYDLLSPFDHLESVDLYTDFRLLKKFLQLDHMNQKSLEVWLGLNREDPFDGGQLIDVYLKFCGTGESGLMQTLLLHNREDVAGMFTLTKLYAYLAFFRLFANDPAAMSALPFSSSLPDSSYHVTAEKEGTFSLVSTFSLPVPVPVPIFRENAFAALRLKDLSGSLRVPIFRGMLYLYFKNYKEYDYLPMEDRAVHRSVADFVNKEFRQPARPENCYERVEGIFLPQPQPIYQPALVKSYKAEFSWFRLNPADLTDSVFLSDYMSYIIRSLFLPPSAAQ